MKNKLNEIPATLSQTVYRTEESSPTRFAEIPTITVKRAIEIPTRTLPNITKFNEIPVTSSQSVSQFKFDDRLKVSETTEKPYSSNIGTIYPTITLTASTQGAEKPYSSNIGTIYPTSSLTVSTQGVKPTIFAQKKPGPQSFVYTESSEEQKWSSASDPRLNMYEGPGIRSEVSGVKNVQSSLANTYNAKPFFTSATGDNTYSAKPFFTSTTGDNTYSAKPYLTSVTGEFNNGSGSFTSAQKAQQTSIFGPKK